MPSGTPAAVRASGSEIAGCPVVLKTGVNGVYSKTLRVQPSASSDGSFALMVPSLAGGVGNVGVSSTSCSSKN